MHKAKSAAKPKLKLNLPEINENTMNETSI